MRGLEYINAVFCPHYHVEKRENSLSEMIAKRGGIGIACDNNAAIEIIGEYYRILTSTSDGKAYKLFKHNGSTVIKELSQNSEYSPLANLLKRK